MILQIESKKRLQPAGWTLANPLVVVFNWELSRLLRGRLAWLMAIGTLLITGFFMWRMKEVTRLVNNITQLSTVVDINSPWGMLLVISSPLLFFLGVVIPFIFTTQISRELKLRTHELLMTTPVPGWSIVTGRFLAGLVACLALAVLILGSILATGLALYLWDGQPLPPVGAVIALWAIIMLPAMCLLAGLSSALSAWLPQRTGIIKALLVLLWFLSTLFIKLPPDATLWYVDWDPTGTLMSKTIDRDYRNEFFATTRFVTDKQKVVQTARIQQQKMPDLGPWLLPQLMWVVAGLALVLVAAWRFKRFGNCLR